MGRLMGTPALRGHDLSANVQSLGLPGKPRGQCWAQAEMPRVDGRCRAEATCGPEPGVKTNER